MIQIMGEGDLTNRLDSGARDEWCEMARTMDGYADTLSGMLQEIYEAAEQVASGAGQIEGSSQSLSKDIIEQATVIEELTASVGQTTAQTRQICRSIGQTGMIKEIVGRLKLEQDDDNLEILDEDEIIEESEFEVSEDTEEVNPETTTL